MIKDTYDKFTALIRGVNDEATKNLLLNMQKSLDYCAKENKVLREVLQEKYKCKHVQLSDAQKKPLSQKAITMNHHILEDVVRIYQPDTVLGWHRELVGKKFDSSENSNKRGPKPISKEFVDSILRFADRNPEWGYKPIASVMTYLEMKVSPSTVKRVLDDHGIVPERVSPNGA